MPYDAARTFLLQYCFFIEVLLTMCDVWGNYFKVEKILKTVFFSGNTANCRDSYTVKIELPQGQINDHYFIDTMNIVIKYQRPRSRGHFELLVSISDNKRSSHDGFTKSGSVSFFIQLNIKDLFYFNLWRGASPKRAKVQVNLGLVNPSIYDCLTVLIEVDCTLVFYYKSDA